MENKWPDETLRMCSLMWIRIIFVFRGSYNGHYENMPIQIYWKFYHQKMKIFR